MTTAARGTAMSAWTRYHGVVPVPGIVLILSALVLTFGVLVPVPPLRAAIVLPLALLTPGYGLLSALYGRRVPFEPILHLGLSFLLSIAAYPLLALLLSVFAIRIATASVVAVTDILLVLLAVAITLRTRHAVPGTGLIPPFVPARAGYLRTLPVLSLAAALGAAAVALHLLPAPADSPYTQFYLAGSWSHLRDAMTTRSGSLSVTVGIANHTGTRQTYVIRAAADGGRHWNPHATSVVPGHSWTGTVSGPLPAGSCPRRLTITLSTARSTHVIGLLTLWVRREGGSISCPAQGVRAIARRNGRT